VPGSSLSADGTEDHLKAHTPWDAISDWLARWSS
jgi:hypothetical protein